MGLSVEGVTNWLLTQTNLSGTEASFRLVDSQFAKKAGDSSGGSDPSAQTTGVPYSIELLGFKDLNVILTSGARAALTYIALQALSTLSLCWNGVLGTAKIASAGLLVATKYERAQTLLEEGAAHLLTAVADYAIGQFALIRSLFALGYGAMPTKTQQLFQKVYRWEGALIHAQGATEEEKQAKRKEFSWIQGTADAIQCALLPDKQGATSALLDRIKGAFSGSRRVTI